MSNWFIDAYRLVFRYDHENRSLPLDMLRGVAILLVLFRHNVIAPANLGALQFPAALLVRVAWAGVDLFFVLSGYLVSGLLFAEYRRHGTVDVKRFIIRRGFKIWPPYFVYLFFVAGWLAMKNHGVGPAIQAIWPNLLHIQNYLFTPRIQTWSLAVEEHFYLLVSLAIFTIVRARNPDAYLRRLPAIACGALICLVGCRYHAYLRHGVAVNLYATHLRFDGLLIGTVLAYLTHFQPRLLAPMNRHPLKLILLGLVLAAPTLYLTPEANHWTVSVGLTALYLGLALVVLGFIHLPESNALWQRCFALAPAAALGHIGFYSYSIYLWHADLAKTPLRKILEHVHLQNLPPAVVWVGCMLIYILVATMAGVILSHLTEKPSLALRNHLFPPGSELRAKPVLNTAHVEYPPEETKLEEIIEQPSTVS